MAQRFSQDKGIILATAYWQHGIVPPSFHWLKHENLTIINALKLEKGEPIIDTLVDIEEGVEEGTGIFGFEKRRVSSTKPDGRRKEVRDAKLIKKKKRTHSPTRSSFETCDKCNPQLLVKNTGDVYNRVLCFECNSMLNDMIPPTLYTNDVYFHEYLSGLGVSSGRGSGGATNGGLSKLVQRIESIAGSRRDGPDFVEYFPI